jgi:hypothetical protein
VHTVRQLELLRQSGGHLGVVGEPSRRNPDVFARTLVGSKSYLADFSAMSSPNHFACSCASVWHPTLTSNPV